MFENLKSSEVKSLQKKYGLNEIRRKKPRTKFDIFIDTIKDPILIIMFFAMLISIITGYPEKHFSEAIVIGVLIIVNITISFVQEVKTLQKLNSLEALTEDVVTVIRDDKEQEILAKELVPGDLVKIQLGIIARADIKLLEANSIRVDEAFLTGESEEVEKEAGDILYSNSPVQNGNGYGVVVATGMDTKIGEITKKVDDVDDEKSQLEIKILDISKSLLIIAIITAVIITILTILNGYSTAETLSITISILIATVPEGLATVLAIVLTSMSQKMAANKALVKKVALLETLGEVEYVCSDKTGTITENKMKVTKSENYVYDEFSKSLQKTVIDTLTPTSRAISDYLSVEQKDAPVHEVIDTIPFNSSIKRSVNLVQDFEGTRYIVCVGAPDFLISNVNQKIAEVMKFADDGLRTILITYKKTNLDNLEGYDLDSSVDLTPLTLYGIQDPPKQSAIDAVKKMHEAFISTVMITGDNIITAKAIAKQAGIIESSDDMALTGKDLQDMSDEEFLKIVEKVKVYARVKPEDKYRIISTLQKKNKIVAMTGDGTNDSIALKKASVGIAMGGQGTDIAKESSDLILLDDNYATINVAIAGGRLIFDNLQKFIRQMLTSNSAHVGGILFALLYGLFSGNVIVLPMTAVLILWVNVVSDAIPCLALGLDNAEEDLMKRPPIDPGLKLLDRPMIFEILLRGLGIGLLVFLSFKYIYDSTGNEVFARTFAFVVLSSGQLIHIFDARSLKTIYLKNPFDNATIWIAVSFSALLNILIIYTPLNNFFGLVGLPIQLFLIAVLISSIPTFGLSLIKLAILKVSKKI